MKRLSVLGSVILATMASSAWSQDRITIPDLCIHDNSTITSAVSISDDHKTPNEDTPSVEIVREILKFVGARRQIDIVAEEGRGNACATITRDQKRIIFIDDPWLRGVTDNVYWLRFFILAHEVGHHINNHPIGFAGRNAYQNEIDADYFAGRMLNIAGAQLDVIEEYFDKCPFQETTTHPPCFVRMAAVREGYESTPPGTPRLENPRPSITDSNSKIEKFDIRVECRKSSDRGCTAHDSQEFSAPLGMLIYSDATIVEAQNGWGDGKQFCNLDFGGEVEVDFVEADMMYRTVRLTAHAESGSGFMNLGKVAFRSCRVAVTLVEQPR